MLCVSRASVVRILFYVRICMLCAHVVFYVVSVGVVLCVVSARGVHSQYVLFVLWLLCDVCMVCA